jgi:hypothetical protein
MGSQPVVRAVSRQVLMEPAKVVVKWFSNKHNYMSGGTSYKGREPLKVLIGEKSKVGSGAKRPFFSL